jgi:hypothetical protein
MPRRLPVRANSCVGLGPNEPGRVARQLSRRVALKVLYGLGLLVLPDCWDAYDRFVTGWLTDGIRS